jgi:hypothetical protein
VAQAAADADADIPTKTATIQALIDKLLWSKDIRLD